MKKKTGSDGWRSVSRKLVHNCWPGEMESDVVCLFWLSGRPQQAPLLGTGRKGFGRIYGRGEMKNNGQLKASAQVK